MQFALLVCFGLGLAVFIARYGLPLWMARVLSSSPVTRLGFQARNEDALLVNTACGQFARGIMTRLCRPGYRWVSACESTPFESRMLLVEGASMTHAALCLRGRETARLKVPPEKARNWVWPAHFGFGMWSALRYGRNFEEVLRLAQSVDAWYRYLVLDGYGFKFGLMDFMRQSSSVAHFHAIPGYYRRAAFQGLGRAMYMSHLSDRPALYEAITEFAPEHDADLIEGVAFQAAYLHGDYPKRAIDLVRAVPYEWRSHAHLGLVLGFHARHTLDPKQFSKSISTLPAACGSAIAQALNLSDESQRRAREHHPVSGYGLWRELLARQLERVQALEPVYSAFSGEGRAGNKGLVL